MSCAKSVVNIPAKQCQGMKIKKMRYCRFASNLNLKTHHTLDSIGRVSKFQFLQKSVSICLVFYLHFSIENSSTQYIIIYLSYFNHLFINYNFCCIYSRTVFLNHIFFLPVHVSTDIFLILKSTTCSMLQGSFH